MRAFKIWNKNKTSSFDLSGLNVITSDIAGLGNRFTNELYDGRIKKHLINQYNSFEQINLTVNFGVNSNAYQKYREFMNFIQANGRNILVIEYYTTGASRFVDVVLSNASKSQKTGFGVLVETITFDRLTPYYILQQRTGRSILVSNRYIENVVPRLELKNNIYPAGTKIQVKSKNEGMPDLQDKEYLGNRNYRLFVADGVTLDYNVFSGIYTLNKSSDFQGHVRISDINSNLGTITLQGWVINGKEQSSLDIMVRQPNAPYVVIGGGKDYDRITKTLNNETQLSLYFDAGDIFNNFQFKIQLEKAENNLELDRPTDELNGYTLREVFGNRNHGMPDLAGKEHLGSGVYSLFNQTDVTLIYNVFNGIYTLNKSGNYQGWVHLSNIDSSLGSITLQGWVINGKEQSSLDIMVREPNAPYVVIGGGREYQSISKTLTTESSFLIYLDAGDIFNDFQFKIQLEQGSNAIPYQVPTNGPYNNLDLGQFNLTPEQVTYYGNLYTTLLETPTEYSKPITDTREIELNEVILSNQELIIDSENKTITLNGANAYEITNKDKSTFLNLPEGDYLIECDVPIELKYKKWVID